MTLPPDRIGDKGQRYQVESRRHGQEHWEVIGWTDSPSGGDLSIGAALHPGIAETRVVDREAKENPS